MTKTTLIGHSWSIVLEQFTREESDIYITYMTCPDVRVRAYY